LRQRKDKHLLFVYTEGEEATMEDLRLSAELTVTSVLSRWPQTIPIFLRHRMACVGCPIAPFETLTDVAAIYGLDLQCFLGELEQIIELEGEII
jgi:hybrid cluster-associated redox disulfide protein